MGQWSSIEKECKKKKNEGRNEDIQILVKYFTVFHFRAVSFISFSSYCFLFVVLLKYESARWVNAKKDIRRGKIKGSLFSQVFSFNFEFLFQFFVSSVIKYASLGKMFKFFSFFAIFHFCNLYYVLYLVGSMMAYH